jgi:hypothetical protein
MAVAADGHAGRHLTHPDRSACEDGDLGPLGPAACASTRQALLVAGSTSIVPGLRRQPEVVGRPPDCVAVRGV